MSYARAPTAAPAPAAASTLVPASKMVAQAFHTLPPSSARWLCSQELPLPASAAAAALKDKNPYVGANNAHRTSGSNTSDADVGYITITASGATITIKSCHKVGCSTAANQQSSIVIVE